MTTFAFDDASVTVIVGSGAGGGTLANELSQKGINVVLLEAGLQQSPATYLNDEWASFKQLAWTDMRTTSGNFRTQTLIDAMLEVGADRIMFSTDWPFENVDHAALWFDACPIAEDDRKKIGRSNAERLFKLGG